jgi:membrane protein
VGIQAILFDIDGTPVDSNDQHALAWEQAFAEFGTRFDRQTIHDQIGKGTDQLVPTLLPDTNEQERDRLGAAQGELFKSRYLVAIRTLPFARELLSQARSAGHKVVLASSASKAELDHYLDLLDAHDLVSATTSADDVENTKPAPDIFSVALRKLAPLTAEEVVVVGDTSYDVGAAAKCGIAAIGLRSGGFEDAALRDAGAVEIYDDTADFLRNFETSALSGRSFQNAL